MYAKICPDWFLPLIYSTRKKNLWYRKIKSLRGQLKASYLMHISILSSSLTKWYRKVISAASLFSKTWWIILYTDWNDFTQSWLTDMGGIRDSKLSFSIGKQTVKEILSWCKNQILRTFCQMLYRKFNQF